MTTVNVVVGRKRDIQVSANATAGSVSTNRNPVTLKNVPTISTGGTNRLDSLNDVVASGEISGAVPVYDAATDKYVVQKLDLNNVIGDLDGGTF
jgi:hypothetical protein